MVKAGACVSGTWWASLGPGHLVTWLVGPGAQAAWNTPEFLELSSLTVAKWGRQERCLG